MAYPLELQLQDFSVQSIKAVFNHSVESIIGNFLLVRKTVLQMTLPITAAVMEQVQRTLADKAPQFGEANQNLNEEITCITMQGSYVGSFYHKSKKKDNRNTNTQALFCRRAQFQNHPNCPTI